jgi:hypothetical protein
MMPRRPAVPSTNALAAAREGEPPSVCASPERGTIASVMRRLAKMARPPMTAAAWWAALWAWRNRPSVAQWARFGANAVRTRRSLRDVALELRVRAALARDPALRRSSEVQVDAVIGHVAHLVGVPGGADTERAATAVARVRGINAVELYDKVALVSGDGEVASSVV